MTAHADDPAIMRRPPNPYRVLAHAIDAGDRPLAALLAAHLTRPGSRHRRAAERVVERLVRALGLHEHGPR